MSGTPASESALRRRVDAALTTPGKVLALLCLMYLIFYIDRVNISTAAPLIQKDLGLSNTELGFAFSAFAYPYALFQIIGGWIGDRLGARRTLGLCGIAVCAATVATGAVGGLATLFAARLALGFGEGAAFPTATRAMAAWTPEGSWGFAQGITHSFARLGNAVTPPLIAALVAALSWRGSFFVLGVLSLVWMAAWVWFFRDNPRDHGAVTAADLARLPPPTRHGQGGSARGVTPWRRLARRMLPVTAVDFCYGWTLWLFLSWIPSFFFKQFHLDLKSSALFSSGVFFAGVVGDTVGGMVSDLILRRSGDVAAARRNVIVAGLLGAFVFLLPVVLVRDLATVAVCLSLAFFFAELVVAPIWSIPMDIAPRYAGTASGMMNFGFGLAGIISPVVFGWLLDATGSWTLPFAGSVALLLAGAGFAFFMHPDRPFEPEPDTGKRVFAR
ncbi:MAG TPA: MFS transporter [Stellaceae bacterium]|jgi:sugar phosphate permease